MALADMHVKWLLILHDRLGPEIMSIIYFNILLASKPF